VGAQLRDAPSPACGATIETHGIPQKQGLGQEVRTRSLRDSCSQETLEGADGPREGRKTAKNRGPIMTTDTEPNLTGNHGNHA
jgi:hypothetical protein